MDIGGGQGHDLEALKNGFPDAKGKLVVQDLPPVLDDIKILHGEIVRQRYNLFTPQPVVGQSFFQPLFTTEHDAHPRIKQMQEPITSVSFCTTIPMPNAARFCNTS